MPPSWQTSDMEGDDRTDSDQRGWHEYYVTGGFEQEPPAERHGNFEQVDWDMRFLSALTRMLSARPWDTGVYEIERLEWADSVMTLVVRVWGRDVSRLVGWREHLPTVRSGFKPDAPESVAGAWHTGEFYPCYLPEPYVSDTDGIHWIGRGRPTWPSRRE